MLTVVPEPGSNDGHLTAGEASLIDQVVRESARRMLAESLESRGRRVYRRVR